MSGKEHVVATAATVSAVLTYAAGMNGWQALAVGVMVAPAALLPDTDTQRSTATQSLGILSSIVCRVTVRTWAGHHRWRTHDAAVGPTVFALATLVMSWSHPGRVAILATAVALGLAALDAIGAVRSTALTRTLATAAAAAAAHHTAIPYTVMAWSPLAVWIGCIAHIAQDALTVQRVPIPGTTLITERTTR